MKVHVVPYIQRNLGNAKRYNPVPEMKKKKREKKEEN